MPEFNPGQMGGTMRLGLRRTSLALSTDATTYISRTYPSMKLPVNGDGDHGEANGHATVSSVVHQLIHGTHYDGRHRHRFEVNPDMVPQLEAAGLLVVGRDADHGNRMEIIELLKPLERDQLRVNNNHHLVDDALSPPKPVHLLPGGRHPYFVATQFHPEYTSRPNSPSPFFVGLLLAACDQLTTSVCPPFTLCNSHALHRKTDEQAAVATSPLGNTLIGLNEQEEGEARSHIPSSKQAPNRAVASAVTTNGGADA